MNEVFNESFIVLQYLLYKLNCTLNHPVPDANITYIISPYYHLNVMEPRHTSFGRSFTRIVLTGRK